MKFSITHFLHKLKLFDNEKQVNFLAVLIMILIDKVQSNYEMRAGLSLILVLA